MPETDVRPPGRPAFAPWDRRELPGLFSVEDSARRVGNYRWTEMRLFAALGGWIATIPELDVKLSMGRHCFHHAFAADLWTKRLPELREMDPERKSVPPNEAWVTFMAKLTEPEAPGLTIEKLVGVYRVLLPHMLAVYNFHKSATSKITDAPTIRSLKFAIADIVDEIMEGEAFLYTLVRAPEHVERAMRQQGELAGLLLQAGGIAGPDSIGVTVGEYLGEDG